MPIFQLDPQEPELFPPAYLAEDDGPSAVGGDLSQLRLLAAYRQGFFPWYNNRSPILWWNPNPRFVLFPSQLKVSKSMRPYFNQQKYRVQFDTDFATVMNFCRDTPRQGQYGSWINNDITRAYNALHAAGYAHSVEVFDQQDRLVGGLYGIALGKVFFGESMFAHARDASKFGFISLVHRLTERGYRLIDCQQETPHLASLGGEGISRSAFMELLEPIDDEPTEVGHWSEPPLR